MSTVLEDLTDAEACLLAIITDPSGLDLAEFCWYSPEAEATDYCWRAWPFQWPWFRCTDSKQIDRAGRSVGKALDLTTPIPTPTGWTTMGVLQRGDTVLDERGQPTVVVEAHDVMLGRSCFEVVFDDGSSIVADGDHLWSTRTKLENRAIRRGREIPLTPRSTLEVANSIRHGGEANHRVPVAETLKLEEGDLPFSPYVLGFWLGDGTSRNGGVTVGQQDSVEMGFLLGGEGFELRANSYQNSYQLHVPDEWIFLESRPHQQSRRSNLLDEDVRVLRSMAKKGVSAKELSIRYGISTQSVCRLVTGQVRRSAGGFVRSVRMPVGRALGQLGVIQNKHIPAPYLRSSHDQRLALLQGLMDSDGHARNTGMCEITQKNEALAGQIVELLRTLGQKPHINKKIARCNGIEAGPVYVVTFRPFRIQPFRLLRKVQRVFEPTRPSRVSERRIVEVRPVPSRPVRCITVDSPSRLYLAGESFIPTHNTVSITLRGFCFPFVWPGEKMLITAPELVHLEPLTADIEERFYATRLGKEMMVTGRSAVNHRPFLMKFQNRSQIMGRIPQRDGRGVKGQHPFWLEQDEAQDYPEKGWTELIECLKKGKAGAIWRAHGVTRGVPDEFWKRTESSDTTWRVHHLPVMYRPTWNAEERAEKIEAYGSKEDPDYRRNILGEPGDATHPIFVLHRLTHCVDDEKESEYNEEEYKYIRMSSEGLSDYYGGDPLRPLKEEIPVALHRQRYKTFWIGQDVGFTRDPSEVLVFAEHRVEGEELKQRKARKKAVPSGGLSSLRLVARVQMWRMEAPEQAKVAEWLANAYNVKAYTFDATGNGLPLYHVVQQMFPNFIQKIKGFKFNENILIDFDQRVEIDPMVDDAIKEAGIQRRVVEWATDIMRNLIDTNRLWLPWDTSLIKEWSSQTETMAKGAVDQYGRRHYSKGSYHSLDAARMAVLGWKQDALEEIVEQMMKTDAVIDRVVVF